MRVCSTHAGVYMQRARVCVCSVFATVLVLLVRKACAKLMCLRVDCGVCVCVCVVARTFCVDVGGLRVVYVCLRFCRQAI